MKTILVFILLCLSSFSTNPARAGTVAGFGGGTEYTQILNNVQLANSYAQMLTNYSTQLQQYQAQLRNLERGSAGQIGAEIPGIMRGIGTIMASTNSIGGTMATIDGNFARTFNSPLAQNFSNRFRALTTTSTATLGASASAAGLQRDTMEAETAALRRAFDEVRETDGTVAAVQKLGAINAQQVQQTQAMRELIATQNIASSTWMAEQSAKAQMKEDQAVKFEAIAAPDPKKYKNFKF